MDRLIRLVIVEDHPVVADGLAARLGQEADISVIGTFGEVEPAVRFITEARPDVVLCDVMFGDVPSGLDLPLRLRGIEPEPTPILFLSSYNAPFFHRTALERGAAGYVIKSISTADLCAAVRAVAGGGTAFAARILRRDPSAPRAPSKREREIIEQVSRGAGNGEIAQRLGISDKTVESHLSRLFVRYRVSSRTELAMLAVHERWVTTVSGTPTNG